jgi:hypothetical protein
VKSRCACEWGGWGRLSDDGPGQNNPDPSEGPWGRWSYSTAWRCMIESSGPTQSGPHRSDHEMHEGRMQTGWRTANAGSRLKPPITQEGTAWTASLSAVTGKTRLTEVRPVKTGMFSRRQTCRGKSQAPRSLDSRVAGNQNPEAYRQGLPWGDYESPGRNDSERKCGLERPDPRAEPASVGRRQNGVPKSDRCGIATSAG